MKAVFISYNQALSERIIAILDRRHIRGYSLWELTHGRGSFRGEPHYGNHTWPSMNSSILTVIDDEKVAPLLASLRDLDSQTEQQGLRAFVWDVVDQL
ncbi:MAG: hypothetical protein IJC16_03480 [Rikenellaceae bacterium]|nr:hypothetical protein [Rikenellaceae bacterium]